MIFRISVAAELSRPALAEAASNSIAIPVLVAIRSRGDFLNAQASIG